MKASLRVRTSSGVAYKCRHHMFCNKMSDTFNRVWDFKIIIRQLQVRGFFHILIDLSQHQTDVWYQNRIGASPIFNYLKLMSSLKKHHFFNFIFSVSSRVCAQAHRGGAPCRFFFFFFLLNVPKWMSCEKQPRQLPEPCQINSNKSFIYVAPKSQSHCLSELYSLYGDQHPQDLHSSEEE